TGVTGTAPPDPLILPNLAVVVSKLDQMSQSVPVNAPWTAASAGDWDGQTLQSWVNDQIVVTQRFREVLPIATRPIFGAEPRELSLLFVLFYVASSGNEQNAGTFERNFNTRGGGQQSRLVGGTQRLANLVAAHLGKRLVLSSPVREIVQRRGGVTVHSDGM